MLGVPVVVVQTQRHDEAAVGESQFGCDGFSEVSCISSTLPDAPKIVALMPEYRWFLE
jgi:hypothetical protein